MTEQPTEVRVDVAPQAAPTAAPAPVVWRSLDDLRREVDRLFDSFHLGGWRLPSGVFRFEPDFPVHASIWPSALAVDVAEKDDAFEITAELPGVAPEDIEVTVSGGRLTLKAEKKAESETSESGRRLTERRYGSFSRSFDLPDVVDAEKIRASHRNGVLTIVLPRSAEAKAGARKIEVNAA